MLRIFGLLSIALVGLFFFGWERHCENDKDLGLTISQPQSSGADKKKITLFPNFKETLTRASLQTTQSRIETYGAPSEDYVDVALPADIMREMESVSADWDKYRDVAYETMDLSEGERTELGFIREKFTASFEGLAMKLSGASKAEVGNIALKLRAKAEEFDSAVESLIGKEKFQYLVRTRDTFNEELDRTLLRPRVNSDW